MRKNNSSPLLIAGILILAGLLLNFFGYRIVQKYRYAAETYTKTDAVVTDKKEEVSEDKIYADNGKYIDVYGKRYEYREMKELYPDEKRYNVKVTTYYDYSFRFTSSDGQTIDGELKRTVEKLGETFPIQYNPENPSEYLIEATQGDVIYFFLGGAVFIIIGLIVLIKREDF